MPGIGIARLTLWFVFAVTVVQAASSKPIDDLIEQLAHPDPAMRRDAFVALRRLGPKATPLLRIALRDARPAVSDAAASLLLAGFWFTADDAKSVQNLLMGYGNLPVEGRIQVLKQILQQRLPGSSKAVVRVASLDPSDDVAWAVFETLPPDAVAALATLDPATRPVGLTVALAKALAARDDLAALPLIRGVLEQEQRQPTATPAQLAVAVRVMADAEARQGDPAAAAARVRELLAGPNEPGDRVELTDQLLALQATHGPLPGLIDDLKHADTDRESHGPYVLALLARQSGLPTAAAALLGAASADRAESDTDRAARLDEAAHWLRTAGDDEAACRVYEKLTAVETEPTRVRVMLAYGTLSQIHERAGRYGAAGDAMQRVISRAQGPLQPNGKDWPIEDQQATVYWFYLLDAAARGDKSTVATQAQSIISSGSTDSALFLNALPQLERIVAPDQLDAYFDRVFERCKAELAETPQEPVRSNDIAWLCARSGRRLPEAIAWAERAVKAMPDEAAYLDTLAEALFRVGRAKESVALETKAISHHPDEETFMRKQLDRFKKAAATQP